MKAYFAYGSNLWLQQMQTRCPELRLVGAAKLKGYRFIITTRGYASVVRSEQDHVVGIIYGISESDEERLDRYQGVGDGLYGKQMLAVDTGWGTINCLVYVDPIEEEGRPLDEYAERVKRGIHDARFSPTYVEKYLRQIVDFPASMPGAI